MIKDIHIEVRSVAPLLMWRWPGDRPTQRMPKTKTQEWIEANWKEQWLRGLYSFKESDGTRVIGLPGENIFSTLKVAGSKLRLGDLINTYTLVLDPWVPLLVYKSAEDTKGVILRSNNMKEFYSEETRDIRMVKLNPSSRTGGKGDRCRPIFYHWGCGFTVRVDVERVGEANLWNVVKTAGDIVGFCDYRPRFGRFRVVSHAPQAAV